MWTRWSDLDRLFGWEEYDRSLSLLDQFRRATNRLFEEAPVRGALRATWPATNLYDGGDTLVLTAEVPGLTEKDIEVQLNRDTLTLTGERRTEAPQGYSVHRRERLPLRFSRSFTLPCRVNAEKASAVVQNGVLTITLAKAPEAQPRQITVSAR
jgi:HSP20 family protein